MQTETQLQYMNTEYWSGSTGGNARVAPSISLVDSPVGKAIRASIESPGDYQGLNLHLPEKIDLRKAGAVSFDIEQTAYKGNGQAAVMLIFPTGSGLIATPEFNASGWKHVHIPMDVRTLKSLGSQSSPALGEIKEIRFSLFSALKSPGQHLSIANLEFHPPVIEEGPVTVAGYRYNAAPTSGDNSCTWLTDGKVDRERQVFFREYSDEPDITFDLGALYLIRKFELEAVAIPSQNISEILLYTSFDGKDWKMAKHIPNLDAGTEEKQYSIAADQLNLLARYIRVHAGRNRTDFPLRFAEITFSGKLPTDAEMAMAAAQQYDLGPELPTPNEANYWKFSGTDGAVWIHRQNGILVRYEKQERLLAERLFSRYELSDGKNPVKADAYSDQVLSGKLESPGVFLVTTTNPALPGGAIPKSGSLRDRVNNTPPFFFCKYSTCFFLLSCYGMLKRIYKRSYGNGDGTTTRVSKGTGEAVWSGARVDCPYNTQVRARTMRMRERQAASVLLSVEVFSRFEKQDPVCEAVRGKGV